MKEMVPPELTHIASTVDEVCLELDPEGDFQGFGDQRWVRYLNVSDDDIQDVILVLESDPPLLTVYVLLKLEGSLASLGVLLQIIARANYGLRAGCFEVDVDSGEARFRQTMSINSGNIEPRTVAQLLSDGMTIAKIYAPVIHKVLRGEASPQDAIMEVERSA